MTGNQRIRVGIIGTGFGANVHAPIMQHHPNFEVVAISSVHRGNLEKVKQETGVEAVYDHWKEMLDNESLDLLSIASAPYLHFEMAMEGMKRNLHILCEKPLAFNAKESKEMLQLKDQTGVFGFTNFEWRFLPARQKVKEILASGQLGKLLHIHYKCTFTGYQSLITNKRGWLGQQQFGGGMLGAIGSHMFDSLLWWTSTKVKDIYGQLPVHVPSTIVDGETEKRTAEDAFYTNGTLETGTTFSVELTSAARHKANQWRLEVYGSNGTLVMTDDARVQVALGNETLADVALPSRLEEPTHLSARALSYYQAFYPMLNMVSQTLRDKKVHPHVPTFEHGHDVQLILDAIRLSAKEGKKITL
ncbi:Gfo/Idh/MocA family protein [Alkalihalobacterium chitinilyticum]|uniref:Gfo/Idh/MocA family oxidoreductase n=1 Tax=Alkalihalobacterium chitinilyticum TaxID=2980103 RepID=A0ABT5VKT8_9BACI|nr:Gfo/Idh/MocA family oxidoreductase [Alkalihalobacterium chitinilyticum]MDE5416063.1 Gfo/Idh/MocA family oxidoreductase [Alkalihalobacterium chitinilyticum]